MRAAFPAALRRPTSFRTSRTAAIRPVDRQKAERSKRPLEAVWGCSRCPWWSATCVLLRAGRAAARAVRAPPHRRRASPTRSTRFRGRERRERRERRALPDRSARSRTRLSTRLDPAVETAAARFPRAGPARDVACEPPEASDDAPWPPEHHRVGSGAIAAAALGERAARAARAPRDYGHGLGRVFGRRRWLRRRRDTLPGTAATRSPHHTRPRRGPSVSPGFGEYRRVGQIGGQTDTLGVELLSKESQAWPQ